MRSISIVLSFLLPTGVLAIALVLLSSDLAEPEEAELAWRGSDAGITVIGNSVSLTAIDATLLQQRLGMTVQKQVLLDSGAPLWYAMIRRAATSGELGSRVLVVGHDDALLTNVPWSHTSYRAFRRVADPHDPAVRARTSVGWVQDKVHEVGGSAATLTRQVLNALVFSVAREISGRRSGRWAYADATREVLGINVMLGANVIDQIASDGETVQPEAAYLGPIIDVLLDASVQPVIVRVPTRPDATVTPDPGIGRLVRARGAVFIDLGALPLRPEDYLDRIHPNRRTGHLMTREILRQLAEAP